MKNYSNISNLQIDLHLSQATHINQNSSTSNLSKKTMANQTTRSKVGKKKVESKIIILNGGKGKHRRHKTEDLHNDKIGVSKADL